MKRVVRVSRDENRTRFESSKFCCVDLLTKSTHSTIGRVVEHMRSSWSVRSVYLNKSRGNTPD